MKIIGITGGVGAGKSEVIRYLEKKEGVQVLLADEVGHLLMKKGERCYAPVCRLFGERVVGPDGELNRPAIAALVYRDRGLLEKLNHIIHPAVRAYIEEVIAKAKKEKIQYFFLETALLLEEHYDKICDTVWYVDADVAVRRRRLRENRQYSDEKITQIMNNQLGEAEFLRRCDVVIHNSGDFEDTKTEIENGIARL